MQACSSDWLTPDWPIPRGVAALCTTRSAGVSTGPFESLNLGEHVGDAMASVVANRQLFSDRLGARPVYLNQVHGCKVAQLDAQTPDGCVADACVTTERGLACTIMVADCLPVLFCSADGSVVGAAHAGWRGLAGTQDGKGVLEAAFEYFCSFAPGNRASSAIKNGASRSLVWLGPCIGPQAFEVGAEVRDAFVGRQSQAANQFVDLGNGKFLANLQGLARQRLAAMGIEQIYGNDGTQHWCTVSNPLRFFSHRRDTGRLGGSGRFVAAIWKT